MQGYHNCGNEIHMYSQTISSCCICAPAGMTEEEVIESANEKFTAINDRKLKAFNMEGFENGQLVGCTHGINRRHWFFKFG